MQTPTIPTLYESLWYRVKDRFQYDDSALFVNMNYDTMLYNAIAQSERQLLDTNYYAEPQHLDKYVENWHWGLIHPHGSIAWGYPIGNAYIKERTRQGMVKQAKVIQEFLRELNPPVFHLPNPFPEISDFIPTLEDLNPCIPALALPLAGAIEKEKFIAPRPHIERLARESNETENLVIIGWRALDSHILEVIRGKNSRTFKNIHIISHSSNGAKTILETVNKALIQSLNTVTMGGGFEAYISSEAFEALYPNPALGHGTRV